MKTNPKLAAVMFLLFVVLTGLVGLYLGNAEAMKSFECVNNLPGCNLAPYLWMGSAAGIIVGLVVGLGIARLFGYKNTDSPETDQHW